MSTTRTAKLSYYVSIPYYDHKVFKCAGQGAESPEHRAFYVPYFEQNGTGHDPSRTGPATVHILPFIADRITIVDGQWVPFAD